MRAAHDAVEAYAIAVKTSANFIVEGSVSSMCFGGDVSNDEDSRVSKDESSIVW